MYQPQHKPRASHDMLTPYATPNGPITYVTEEVLYENGPGMSRSEAMGASQESSYQRYTMSNTRISCVEKLPQRIRRTCAEQSGLMTDDCQSAATCLGLKAFIDVEKHHQLVPQVQNQ